MPRNWQMSSKSCLHRQPRSRAAIVEAALVGSAVSAAVPEALEGGPAVDQEDSEAAPVVSAEITAGGAVAVSAGAIEIPQPAPPIHASWPSPTNAATRSW